MSHVFFKGGTLIDGNGGVMEDSGVLIRDDVIVRIGKASEANLPLDTHVQEIGGKVIMPGLIDAHVHLVGVRTPNPISASFTPPELLVGRSLNDTKKLIEAGFTSVRDVGSHIALHVRNLIAEGEYEGPRIKASYKLLSQTGGHGDLHMLPPEFNSYGHICDGVAECRKAARTMFREGADFIKVCASGGVISEKDDPRSPQFTLEELEAIVYEAGAVGSYVAAHAHSTLGIKNALRAGVKTIEHGILMDDEAIELMLDRDAILVPTMTITSLLVAHGSRIGLPESTLRKAQLLKQVHTQNLQMAYRAGVKIATGTDLMGVTPVEHGQNAMELSLLVSEVGLSPMEAIIAATKTAAAALALQDSVGTVEPGKKADLLVVSNNPLQDINVLTDTANIEQVYVGGKRLK
ncbi:metal-dependent hydrolase family protein [Paenibacillus elgii]|uniref:metal-dependent hydrolase family protein n=1 Tax=Paenibacillus elgii TaxID=189691 RepID=UPI00204161E7|nr:amidohydrolase family protein [Paenibacillus elgii]MCM3270757.1 amidohydrolase family protein [Paenibacillus elgii]